MWQPIETAPEGIPIWLWDGVRIWVGTYEYDSDGWIFTNTYGHHYFFDGKWETDVAEFDDDYKVIKWMHLPEPPKD